MSHFSAAESLEKDSVQLSDKQRIFSHLSPLAPGLTELEKNRGDSKATPLGFHDLFSHQVLDGEITSCPLLLNELRVVRDMRYLENEGTKTQSSEVNCLSKAKN